MCTNEHIAYTTYLYKDNNMSNKQLLSSALSCLVYFAEPSFKTKATTEHTFLHIYQYSSFTFTFYAEY